jgi:penicillin amidase
MIIKWTGPATTQAYGIYPGGQSENPASPWYEDLLSSWLAGRYLPFPGAGAAPGSTIATWTLES